APNHLHGGLVTHARLLTRVVCGRHYIIAIWLIKNFFDFSQLLARYVAPSELSSSTNFSLATLAWFPARHWSLVAAGPGAARSLTLILPALCCCSTAINRPSVSDRSYVNLLAPQPL